MFEIHPGDAGDALVGRVSLAPCAFEGRTAALPIRPPPCRPREQTDHLEHGKEIREGLMAHPDMRLVLDRMHGSREGDLWEISFGVSGPSGEAIHWEVMLDTNDRHLALRGSRRLMRIADDRAHPEIGVRKIPRRLRVVALVSAAGVDGWAEFKSLSEAVHAGKEAGLDVELTVFAGEDRLLQADGRHSNVVVRPMPGSPVELSNELACLKPHVLHCFCHGRANLPQGLEFATRLDRANEEPNGSVLYSIDRLIDAHVLDDAWWVLLNCCDGSRPVADFGSMAYRLVADAAVPAAVGMSAPLPALAAPILTRAFYVPMFVTLAKQFRQLGGDCAQVDFGAPLAEARLALHDAAGTGAVPTGCWTMPVIYLHRRPLLVLRSPTETDFPAMLERVRIVAGLLQVLPPTAPSKLRDAALALFDLPPIVPDGFRCDRFGISRFGGDPR